MIVVILLLTAVGVGTGILSCIEATEQERNHYKWFWLGFFFGIHAFIGLKLSKYAKKETHDEELWSILGVVFGVNAIIGFVTALNAEKSGNDFDCWAILGFTFGWIAFILSLFLKRVVVNKN